MTLQASLGFGNQHRKFQNDPSSRTVKIVETIKHAQVDQPEESRENIREQLGYRKRKKSFGGGIGVHNSHGVPDSNYIPPNKKNRYFRRKPSVLPSKFLLGGNINDPLNLNSLGNSDNAETPKSSPIPVPAHRVGEIPVFIPKNPGDPLGLRCGSDIETLQDMIAGVRTCTKHRKNRHRRRNSMRKRNDSECSVETLQTETETDDFAEESENEIEPQELPLENVSTSQTTTGEIDKSPMKPSSSEVSVCSKSSCPQREPEDATIELLVSVKLQVPSGKVAKTSITNNEEADLTGKEIPVRTSKSSDYVPMSSSYQSSPFILQALEQSSVEMITLPFESPSITNYSCQGNLEPFSPPPRQTLLEPPRRQPSGPLFLRPQMSVKTALQDQPNYSRSIYRKRLRHKLDPIVSPVIPQPGVRRSRHYNHSHGQGNQKKVDTTVKSSSVVAINSEMLPIATKTVASGNKFRPKDEIFQYGNYNRYYGYRNGNNVDGAGDARLRVLKKDWIEGKDVLDVGCNIGHITLSVARDYCPKRIVGIDIDKHLIEVARKNIMYYVDRGPTNTLVFPQSFSSIYGPLHPPPTTQILALNDNKVKPVPFPYNVTFLQENYVLESDELLDCVRQEYDVILCLSLTKWIHLNFGDDGLKRFFHRGFRHLRPGGLYILEPQPWSSYQRKKKLTERISKNASNIRFFPEHFQDFLLNSVGYRSVDNIGIPNHHLKGFQRPLLVFRKGKCEQIDPCHSGADVLSGPVPIPTPTQLDTNNESESSNLLSEDVEAIDS